jgi:hypothetical protein
VTRALLSIAFLVGFAGVMAAATAVRAVVAPRRPQRTNGPKALMVGCPRCGAAGRVLTTRASGAAAAGVVRRYVCADGHRWTTLEVVLSVPRCTACGCELHQVSPGVDGLRWCALPACKRHRRRWEQEQLRQARLGKLRRQPV